jgi:hypothetical protein
MRESDIDCPSVVEWLNGLMDEGKFVDVFITKAEEFDLYGVYSE